MKRQERLEYLKNVRRKEIQEQLKAAREFGDLENNAEYDFVKKEQAKIEMEILAIENGEDFETVDFEECGNVFNKKGIFKYFDNEEFIEPNLDKEFTDEEKVSIIIRSKRVSLKEKEQDLIEIANTAQDELKNEVFAWINNQKNCLSFIDKLDRTDVVFGAVCNVINAGDKILDYCRTFKQASKITGKKEICINYVNNDEGNENNSIYYSGELGKVFFDGNEISSISLYLKRFEQLGIETPKLVSCKSTLYNIQVHLNHPFKKYDLIKLPLRNAYHVVSEFGANEQENEKIIESNYIEHGWLVVKIPVYSQAVLDGGYTYTSCITNTIVGLGDIRKVEEDEMTVSQLKWIQSIQRENGDL